MQDALKAFGDVYMTLLIGPDAVRAKHVDEYTGRVKLTRGPLSPEVTEDSLSSLSRELKRAAGYPGYET